MEENTRLLLDIANRMPDQRQLGALSAQVAEMQRGIMALEWVSVVIAVLLAVMLWRQW